MAEQQQSTHEDEAEENPLRIVPLDRVYSTPESKPLIVYQRKRKRGGAENKNKKRSKELEKLVSGLELTTTAGERSRLRGIGRDKGGDKNGESSSRKRKRGSGVGLSSRGSSSCSSWIGKKWVELEIEGADPLAFVGLACKVFWPLDDDWYTGTLTGYSEDSKQHNVEYKDGDKESIDISQEKIKFNISYEEMQSLNLKLNTNNLETRGFNELLALAYSFHDCQDLEPGDLVWAKLTGHAMWPAVVVDESNVCMKNGLKLGRADQSILVQFFGTHDFARIKLKYATPFLNGLLSSLHLKCKQASFSRSLDEAKLYLSTQQLPNNMQKIQKNIKFDESRVSLSPQKEELNASNNNRSETAREKITDFEQIMPIQLGNLTVTSLGRIVCDSDHFHNKQHIWPEGYTAFRKFKSTKDRTKTTSYKMEVLRNPKFKARPLFRVSSEDKVQIEGPTPRDCWREIYRRINKLQLNGLNTETERNEMKIKNKNKKQNSGSHMFGFSYRRISQLIQEMPNAKLCSKYFESTGDLPLCYRAVRVDWKDLDRCSVCDMDEEYEDNLFLQCDKCRMMVHARCYGELEPLDGVLWLCNLCRPGAPDSPPRCCLCPITGGALKQTTDGKWAHLTCAIWIPETCLVDIKRMEPIDGISTISKDRWKLLCSICGVNYGACIQCSHYTCRVAYHPLCARAAGLCVELENEDKFHLLPLEEEEEHCIRLLSYCKKHRQPSKERLSPAENPNLEANPNSDDKPGISHSNPSGCARCEPYNFLSRRGQKQPEALAAASAKRLYVENRPYLVTGGPSCTESTQNLADGVLAQQDLGGGGGATVCVSSMAEKYACMKESYRKRLAFGKSRIHGFGVFAKVPHKAGDMVIEYIGELVRPHIADIREKRIYNSLVGAGTYMFRIDDERVVDATRAGSIAHLINHSCEPNCYSRMISVSGNEHIIIFAKRDINQWEELTYDYRFFSAGEQLSCSCGSQRCRGVVNDVESQERSDKIKIPKSELLNLLGEIRTET
ncbi:hypothetical protein LUZ60_008745 [Juncus effusus]|nr:hypothetical protein LUZ60_008745 [Juncus effusus]